MANCNFCGANLKEGETWEMEISRALMAVARSIGGIPYEGAEQTMGEWMSMFRKYGAKTKVKIMGCPKCKSLHIESPLAKKED